MLDDPVLVDYTPARLRKLMLRLAQLQPNMAYAITLIVLDKDSEPVHVVTQLGKIENNYGQPRQKVIH